jgi:signal transduction histidine kinase
VIIDRLNPRRWPLTAKVPVLVATLVIVVAVGVSKVVLSRLSDTQAENLQQLGDAYLDGLSTALQLPLGRQDIWEAFDVLDRARTRYQGVRPVFTLVALPDSTILASSEPRQFPVGMNLTEEMRHRIDHGQSLSFGEAQGRAWLVRALSDGGLRIGTIIAQIDISELERQWQKALLTLIVLNSALTLGLSALGYLLVRRMLAPVTLLTAQFDRAAAGDLTPLPKTSTYHPDSEFGRLLRRYNDLAAAVAEREALSQRLAQEGKVAVLGRIASGMAHEVNNPLGGLFNALALLRQHWTSTHVREDALRLLDRGLNSIRNIVRATLVAYKEPSARTDILHGDLEDVRFLVNHEVERRSLALEWRNDLPAKVAVSAVAVRQIALNLLLNACAASPVGGRVEMTAASDHGGMSITVQDSGPGLPDAYRALLVSPEGSPVPDGPGLGLWAVARTTVQLGGQIIVTSAGEGTAITVKLPLHEQVRLDAAA